MHSVMQTTPDVTAKKPRKVASASPRLNTVDRTQATWLVRDDKLLVSSLALDIYAIAASLQRDPLTVLQRLAATGVSDALQLQGLDFEFDQGSEEQAELFGLALSGIPLKAILQWCLAKDDRPTTAQLIAMMSTADFRPAMYMARELGICFSSLNQIDGLRELEQVWPHEIVQAGVEAVIANFDIPIADNVLARLEGDPVPRAKPYPWFDINASSKEMPKGKKRSYPRKTKSTRTTTWKPYRKSRRTYATKKRTCA